MLTICPECQSKISDKALACPHCGFPLQVQTAAKPPAPMRKRSKRRRLPNGFGQIMEVKNRNLRKPFRAMVTVGKTDEGKPICKLLQPQAYFETYNEAYSALLEFNKNPFDISDSVTMNELYEKWIASYSKKVGEGNIISTRSAWKYAAPLYDLRIRNVRVPQLKNILVNGEFIDSHGKRHTTTPSLQNTLKKIFNLMFDYAVENELTDKNYARLFRIPNEAPTETVNNVRPHISLTHDELQTLWNAIDSDPTIEIILVQCYSGWRASELLQLKLSDIDLDRQIMLGGAKTAAGKKRIVPIHPKILPIIQKRYHHAEQNGFEYPFYIPASDGSYRKPYYALYSRQFSITVESLGMAPHNTHDCRKTFVTRAKAVGMDEYAIKRLIGHHIKDLTERVYTERSVEWLRTELNKIPD